jgi:hypothetical protein
LQYACKRCNDPSNPDCKNYDPCYGKTAASADFDIFERNRWKGGANWIEVKSDTIIYGAFGVFRAKQNPDNDIEYNWKIGFMEQEFTEPEVRLIFGNEVFGQTLPIRLITTKKQDQTCITNPKELRDTVTKFLHITSPMRSRIFGKYEGEQLSEDGTFKKYTLEIVPKQDPWSQLGPETLKTISFKNIDNLGCYEESTFLDEKSLFFNSFSGVPVYANGCVFDNEYNFLSIDSLKVENSQIFIKYRIRFSNTFEYTDSKIFIGEKTN